MNELLTDTDVAVLLGISRTSVRSAIARGTLRPVRQDRAWRHLVYLFDRSEIDRYRRERYRPWNRRVATERDGFVYLIRASNGLYKLGVTNDPEGRVQSLATMSPLPVELVFASWVTQATSLEYELARHYQDVHSHAEWFRLASEQVAEIIQAIAAAKRHLER